MQIMFLAPASNVTTASNRNIIVHFGYVCIATGLDYAEAAPVSGMRLGEANESLNVEVQVQQ